MKWDPPHLMTQHDRESRNSGAASVPRPPKHGVWPANGGGYARVFVRGAMIGLLQRVSHAEVRVETQIVGAIQAGLVVLVGVERGDTEAQADRLLERLLTYRVFPDAEGRMNRSVRDIEGGLLLVSQFTLAAETSKGTRPGFSPAAEPGEGRKMFEYFVRRAREQHRKVETGEFGAHMQLTLTNDGPVTFWMQVRPPAEAR